MSQHNERGATGTRQSALWGTGSRGGDRSSVLWGKGGRGILVSCICVIALAAPIAASAGNGHGKNKGTSPVVPVPTTPVVSSTPAPPSGDATNTPDGKTWIASGLLDAAKTKPNDKVAVIITSSDGVDGAGKAYKWLARAVGNKNDVNGDASTSLDLVGGVAVSVSAKVLTKLQQVPGLIVTPDALVQVSGLKTTLASSQIWPYESGNTLMWAGDQFLYAGKTPAIAVVDSGVQQRSDFGTRIVASVNLSTIDGNTSLDDQRGHGTFVAGIAAGSRTGSRGCRPGRSDRLDQGDGREWPSEDVRRHQRLPVDPRSQGSVQHQGRELLAALELRARTSTVTRSTGQSSGCGSAASPSWLRPATTAPRRQLRPA